MVKVIPASLDTKSSTSASAEFVRTLRTAGTDCSGATNGFGATDRAGVTDDFGATDRSGSTSGSDGK